MIIETVIDNTLDSSFLPKYFDRMINQFFKLLPIKEKESETFVVYAKSLQAELYGSKNFIVLLNDDVCMFALIAILQYFIDTPDITVKDVRREVFHSIDICNKLKDKFSKDVRLS